MCQTLLIIRHKSWTLSWKGQQVLVTLSTRTEVNYPALMPVLISLGQKKSVRDVRQAVKAEGALEMKSDTLFSGRDRWQGMGNGEKAKRTEGWPVAMQYDG